MFTTHQYSAIAQYAKWVVEPIYDEITEFVGDVAAVKRDGKWGYINRECVEVVPCAFDNITPFVEDVAIATADDNTLQAIIHKEDGLIIDHFKNQNGGTVTLKVDPRYKNYGNDMLLVTDGRKGLVKNVHYTQWGYLDKNGILRHPIKYFAAMPFSDGKAAVANEKLRYSYINNDGDVVIASNKLSSGKATGAFGFYNGVAIICEKDKFVYIDSYGRKIADKTIGENGIPTQKYYDMTSNIIDCNFNKLFIDSSGRISKIIQQDGNEIELIKQPKEADPIIADHPFNLNGVSVNETAQWITPTLAVLDDNNKYGIIRVQSTSVVSIELNLDSVYSVFGNIEPLPFVLSNKEVDTNLELDEQESLDHLKIIVGGVESEQTTIPAAGFESAFLIEKPTDLELDSVQQSIQITQRGVLLFEQTIDIEIMDKPSLVITGRDDYKHYADSNTFSMSIDIENLSNYEFNDAILVVNNYQRKISIEPNSIKNFPIIFGVDEMGETIDISISVKHPKSPIITKQGSLTID